MVKCSVIGLTHTAKTLLLKLKFHYFGLLDHFGKHRNHKSHCLNIFLTMGMMDSISINCIFNRTGMSFKQIIMTTILFLYNPRYLFLMHVFDVPSQCHKRQLTYCCWCCLLVQSCSVSLNMRQSHLI